MCSAGMRSADSITILFECGFNRNDLTSSTVTVARPSPSARRPARPGRPRRPHSALCTNWCASGGPTRPGPAEPTPAGGRLAAGHRDGPELGLSLSLLQKPPSRPQASGARRGPAPVGSSVTVAAAHREGKFRQSESSSGPCSVVPLSSDADSPSPRPARASGLGPGGSGSCLSALRVRATVTAGGVET